MEPSQQVVKVTRDVVCSGFSVCLTQDKPTVNGRSQAPTTFCQGAEDGGEISLDLELNQGSAGLARGAVGRTGEHLLRASPVRGEFRLFLAEMLSGPRRHRTLAPDPKSRVHTDSGSWPRIIIT